MKVLSLFDGISGARQALKELNINCEYYASEIDKFAIQVAKNNHPDIIHIGDVKEVVYYFLDGRKWLSWRGEECGLATPLSKIDLLIGGSPCQDLSVAKRDRKGLDGERSGLFYEYLRILNEVKPKYFILENVASMSKEAKNIITKELFDIEPIFINSALVTAQQRKRLYWVGKLQKDKSYKKVEIPQPEDKNIFLKDILENGDTEKLKSYCITATYSRACTRDYFEKKSRQLIFKNSVGCSLRGRYLVNGIRRDIRGAKTQQRLEFRNDEKTNCLTSVSKDSLIALKNEVRRLTTVECARLQGFPDNYCEMISQTQAYKAYGNSFTVPVIKHILKNIYLN